MEKKYYSKFLYTLFTMWFIALLAGFLSSVIQTGELPEWNRQVYPILSFFLLSLIVTCIAVPISPVIIRPGGLTTYTAWGTYSTITWDDVVTTNTFNLLGLRYVTIRTKQNQTLYIPRFLNNYIGFRDQISAWAGEEHLLTQALRAG